MRTPLLLALLLAVLAACGSSSGGPPTSGGAAPTTCFDSAGNPTSTCATTLAGDLCAAGDANHCAPLSQVGIYADNGTDGVCVHLVFDNNCDGEIFADTCIAHGNYDGGVAGQDEQCWTSSVLPGGTIDVRECHATGAYFFVATATSSRLDGLEQTCPAPPISGGDGGR